MAGGSSLSEEALLVSGAQEPSLEWHMKVQQLLRMQSHDSGSSMMRKKSYSPDVTGLRVDRIEPSKEPEPVPSMTGVSEIAAFPPSPITDDPSALPSPIPSPSSSQ